MNNQQNKQDQKATLPTLDVKRAIANSTGMSKIAELRAKFGLGGNSNAR
ncbi:hypothetical protein [Rouxiella sp. Mn2063]